MILRICHIFSQFLQQSIQSLLLWLGRSLTTVSSWAGWMKRINLEMALLNAGPASLWSRWTPKHTHTAPYTCQFFLFDGEDYFFEYLSYYVVITIFWCFITEGTALIIWLIAWSPAPPIILDWGSPEPQESAASAPWSLSSPTVRYFTVPPVKALLYYFLLLNLVNLMLLSAVIGRNSNL